MGTEIERKFLVINSTWRDLATPVFYRQGYLCREADRTVRIRIAGNDGYITIKGRSAGAVRAEFEYPIPIDDAAAMLSDLCVHPLIEKHRSTIEYRGMIWEVDEFFGENEGLIIAEVELRYPDQSFETPSWIGKEVTDDHRYANANLVNMPFSRWP